MRSKARLRAAVGGLIPLGENHMSYGVSKPVQYGRHIVWITILLLVVHPSPIVRGPYDISFENLPYDLRAFHQSFEFTAADYIFVVTWYPVPYPDYFFVVHLGINGVVIDYVVIPDWAIQGGMHAELTESELHRVGDALEIIAETPLSSEGIGSNVIAVNMPLGDGVQIAVCTDVGCPREVRDLFEITSESYQREHPGGILREEPFAAALYN